MIYLCLGSSAFYKCDRGMGSANVNVTFAYVTYANVTHVKHTTMLVKINFFFGNKVKIY